MPRRCSCFGCKGNYDGMPYVKVISFPKDPEERERWILAMPNEKESLRRLKEIYICETHFKCEWVSVKGGKRPREPPSIFPGVPKSALKQVTSAPRPTSSSTSEARAKKVHAAAEAADKIQDFDHFCAKISSYFPGFKVIKDQENLYLSITDATGQTVKQFFHFQQVSSHFGFLFLNRVEKDGIEVPKPLFLLQKNSLLSKWSQIRSITEQVNTYEYTSQEILQHVISQLCNMTEAHELAHLTFLLSQLRLVFKHTDGRRFDTDTMIFALQLHNISPSAYKMIRQSGLIILPSTKKIDHIKEEGSEDVSVEEELLEADVYDTSHVKMEDIKEELSDVKEESIYIEEPENYSKELKNSLEGLESYFVFAKFDKAEEKKDGKSARLIYSGKAKCMHPRCKTKGSKALHSFNTQSRSHFRRHYVNVHKEQLPQLSAALERNSKRGRRSKSSDSASGLPSKKRQLSLEESFTDKNKLSNEEARMLWTRWFIDTMMPISLTDHPTTRLLMAKFKPEFDVPSRRSLFRDIDKAWEQGMAGLINLLHGQKMVATTADSWTAHHRAFLGMTVHWIDQSTLQRKYAVLACKELKDRQTLQLLGQTMSDIHQEFGLSGKVAGTTTDNGANYCAGFRHYAAEEIPLPVQPEEEEDTDVDVVVCEITDVQEQLMNEEAGIELPPHHRCSAHTLNLLATVDIAQVPGWNHELRGGPWKKAAAKAQSLWNLQNRSSVAANQIKAAINKKLTTPVVTRWNSYFDSVKVLLDVLAEPSHLEAINSIIMNQTGGARTLINVMDIKIFSEYRQVMEPVAACLDKLQGEENAYMGILLPSLHIVKCRLERERDSGNLQHAIPLVEALLKGLNTRFNHFYVDRDVLMATALHPHYTSVVLKKIAPDSVAAVKEKIVNELKTAIMSAELDEQQPSEARSEELSEDTDFLDLLLDDDAHGSRGELGEVLSKILDDWQRAKNKTPLSQVLFPMQHREAWVDLFIKYNTPLPSSAAVERLFSVGGDVLRPKRASLSASNFERLVFMKGNMDLLEFKNEEEGEE